MQCALITIGGSSVLLSLLRDAVCSYHYCGMQCAIITISGCSVLLSLFRYAVCSYHLLTWILGVASKQLRLLHGRVGDSTIVVNSLSPQMSELVEDAIAS